MGTVMGTVMGTGHRSPDTLFPATCYRIKSRTARHTPAGLLLLYGNHHSCLNSYSQTSCKMGAKYMLRC